MGLVAATRETLPDGTSRMPSTIVLVPTRPLIRQTMLELAARHPEVETGYLNGSPILDGAGKPGPRRVAPVTLMTYAQFMLLAEVGEIRSEDVDHLVMDKAHRGLSDMRRGVVAAFREGGRTVVSTFTATPAFDEFKALDSLLGEENEVVRVSQQRLRDGGFLGPGRELPRGGQDQGRPAEGPVGHQHGPGGSHARPRAGQGPADTSPGRHPRLARPERAPHTDAAHHGGREVPQCHGHLGVGRQASGAEPGVARPG